MQILEAHLSLQFSTCGLNVYLMILLQKHRQNGYPFIARNLLALAVLTSNNICKPIHLG